MDELTGVFVQESREQLAEMEAGLLALEADPEDASDINAIFRAAHTIKGGAGVVECVFLEGFTHKVENLLDQLRDGRLNPTEARISLLLDCADHIGQLLGLLERGDRAGFIDAFSQVSGFFGEHADEFLRESRTLLAQANDRRHHG